MFSTYIFHNGGLEIALVFIFAVNDTLDDILAESGDEEESDNIVTQVLDEIGIEISGKVSISFLLGSSIFKIKISDGKCACTKQRTNWRKF